MIDENIINKKMEQVRSMLEVDLDVDSDDLQKLLTCGDNWDDHNLLLRAMDNQPVLYAQWAYFLKQLKIERTRAETMMKLWISNKKEEIFQSIYDKNIEGGMTANNAKPTGAQVDNQFSQSLEVDEDGNYMNGEYRSLDNILQDISERVAQVEVVKEAFVQRKDMLISMASLLKAVIDNNLYINKKKMKQKQDDEFDFEE